MTIRFVCGDKVYTNKDAVDLYDTMIRMACSQINRTASSYMLNALNRFTADAEDKCFTKGLAHAYLSRISGYLECMTDMDRIDSTSRECIMNVFRKMVRETTEGSDK